MAEEQVGVVVGMVEDNLIGGAVVQFGRNVLLLQTEQIVEGAEDELILEDGRRVQLVRKAVLHFLLHDEVVIVNVGFEDWHVVPVHVHEQLHLSVDVQHSLVVAVPPQLQVQHHEVIFQKFESHARRLLKGRQEDLMDAAVTQC